MRDLLGGNVAKNAFSMKNHLKSMLDLIAIKAGRKNESSTSITSGAIIQQESYYFAFDGIYVTTSAIEIWKR